MDNRKEIPDYMSLQNDFIFKRLFGYEGNEDITKDLVSNIIGKKIKTLEFKNPYLLRETKEDKEEILDIKAVLDDDILCDVEIQVGNYHDIEKRILDYWSKLYRESIGRSKEYKDMKRTIVILITTFDIDSLKGVEEYRTRWKILEEKLKIKLTDIFEVDIIELSKAERQLKQGTFKEIESLKEWIEFLINPRKLEETKMEEVNEEIKKAYEIWHNMDLSFEERDAAERRYRNYYARKSAMEYDRKQARAEGRAEGIAEGRVEGRKEGIKEGIKEEKIEIARAMLKKDMPIEMISEITKLSIEEIKGL